MDTPERLPGYHGHRSEVLARLRRIEGQVRGLHRLVEQNTYCIDVLTQVAATTKALQGVATQLLTDHLHHCVADAASAGDAETTTALVDQATRAIERLLRA
jgi:DNA-binding FrmR family transcriptional regulator